jgi:hypothetical protein
MARKTQQRLPSGGPSVVEMYVPLDEVDTVVEREPAVHVQMVFEMTEETFYTVGRARYLGVSQIVKHVWQSVLDGDVRTPQHFVRVPTASRLFVARFLLKEIFVPVMPLGGLASPRGPVVLCVYLEQREHQLPEFGARQMFGKPRQP